jgi:dATP pyrophosphohydrolase
VTAAFRRPESVLVVVYTRDLDVLLLERVSPPGFWQSVTGGLEWGESQREAAERELREETGLPPAGLRDGHVSNHFPILPAWRDRFAPDVATNLEHLWYLELPAACDVVWNPKEHVAAEWLPVAEAIERVSSWTNRAALETLVQQT